MLHVFVTGKRCREIGLVVPGSYRALTKSKRAASILREQLTNKKESWSLALTIDNSELRLIPISV